MYLPLELNTPALIGGVFHHFVTRKADHTGGEAGQSMRERGVIIASGLMAGGALGGVFGAVLRNLEDFGLYREDAIKTPFFDVEWAAQTVSALAFAGLCLYLWMGSMRRAKA
jgi:hypothetical protein